MLPHYSRSRWPAMASMLVTACCVSALLTGPAAAQAGADGEWTMPARD
jgi:hypothetical protein